MLRNTGVGKSLRLETRCVESMDKIFCGIIAANSHDAKNELVGTDKCRDSRTQLHSVRGKHDTILSTYAPSKGKANRHVPYTRGSVMTARVRVDELKLGISMSYSSNTVSLCEVLRLSG